MKILPKNPGQILLKMTFLAVIFALIYFVLPKVVGIFMPFIIAYIISKAIMPCVNFLETKIKIPKVISIIFVMLASVGFLAFLLFVIFYQAVYELQRLAYIIPDVLEGSYSLPAWVEDIVNNIKAFYDAMPDSLREFVVMIADNLRTNLYSLLEPATQAVIGAAANIGRALPNLMIATVVMLLSIYFICNDRDNIKKFISTALPEPVHRRVDYVKNDLFKACGGYIKAQGILMCITFVILIFGFMILGVKSSALVAFIVAIVDAIPILGTGTILIPWAIISLLTGKYFFALGIVIIYALTFLVRRFAEPKVVSRQIGLHPLVTLISVYVGLKAAGVFGMILGPIVAIIIINFVKAEQHFENE